MINNAYDVEWRIEPFEVNLGYGRRGRPNMGESPGIVTEYRVDVELSFNEERAVALSQDRGVKVLVTNLPRSMQDEDNIRSGATADTVLKTYLGQSRIEHVFRIMKDGMSMDRVYLHRPSRENAMMFVISLATMMSDIIHHVLVSEGIDHTAEDLAGRMTILPLVHNREQDEETLDGPEALQGLFIDCIEVMRIDSDHIIH
ncbi:MAG: transposase [Candidatus Methanomethylophilaceae archaeon]|nr:transposase [Candidatus Methanomethylophilaceae archaeon]